MSSRFQAQDERVSLELNRYQEVRWSVCKETLFFSDGSTLARLASGGSAPQGGLLERSGETDPLGGDGETPGKPFGRRSSAAGNGRPGVQ